MRIIGCCFIFLWITTQGYGRKRSLECKKRQWELMSYFLQLLQEKLRSSSKNTGQMLEEIMSSCSDLVFLQLYEKEQGPVQQRLKQAAEQLEDEDMKELALHLAQHLGTASAEIQLESLREMERQCQRLLEHHREKALQEGPFALRMGMLCGAAAAILLL